MMENNIQKRYKKNIGCVWSHDNVCKAPKQKRGGNKTEQNINMSSISYSGALLWCLCIRIKPNIIINDQSML